MMGPLIDKQLQKIDHKHAVLEDLNMKLLEAFQIYNNLMKESISKTASLMGPLPNINAYSNINLTATNNPALNGANSIPFAAAPPSFDQSSLMLANQLNNMTVSNSNLVSGPIQATPAQVMMNNYLNQPQMVQSNQYYQQQQQDNQIINNLPAGAPIHNQMYATGAAAAAVNGVGISQIPQNQMSSMVSMSNPNYTN
jgi:hypothetical protein